MQNPLYSLATILRCLDDDALVWSILWRIAAGSLGLLIFGWLLAVLFLSALEVYQ